jgi:hypothetical protein
MVIRYRLLLAALAILLVTLACSFNFNLDLPKVDIKTGPTESEQITVPVPESEAGITQLNLTFGAGQLNLSPGTSDALVSGTATYNVRELKPVIETQGNTVTLRSGDLTLDGIPNLSNKLKNIWDLQLSQSPLDLAIKAGAYKGKLDLGGLALNSLEITDGAAEVNLNFSTPNLVEMDTLQYKSGASTIQLSGLANANFNTMTFKAGAGNYTLDFSGKLQRDATVVIDAGMSDIKLVVPEGTHTRLFFDGGLSNVDVYGAWEKSGNDYSLAGEGPTLTINVNLGAGNLQLRNK